MTDADGRWRTKLNKLFKRSRTDHPISFSTTSSPRTPSGEEGRELPGAGIEQLFGIYSVRDQSRELKDPQAFYSVQQTQGGQSHQVLCANTKGRSEDFPFYQAVVLAEKGKHVPAKQKVQKWLDAMPDTFEPIPDEPLAG